MKFKMFVVFLSFIFLCSGFAGETFFCSAYAQNKKIVSKKQTSQKPTKKWRVVTLGEHGQFKGADGFQMALNMAQDMDEIRIEKGTIEASGLVIPENKEWPNGIKISGGWNEIFTEQSNNPDDTDLVGNENDKKKRILTIANQKCSVVIENITFSNNTGGAIEGNVILSTCVFTNNSASYYGGAVRGDNCFFTNCTFINNSVTGLGSGGAVSSNGSFINCIFTNNSASNHAGAISGNGTFTNCTFTNNSATNCGGAVSGKGIFTNCTFTNNSVSGGFYQQGGAVSGDDSTFVNSTFTNNSANSHAGAVSGDWNTFAKCTFTNNSTTSGNGGAVKSGGSSSSSGSFTDCIFLKNSANDGNGGAIGDGAILTNCIFIQNSANGGNGGATGGSATAINCVFINNTSTKNGGANNGSDNSFTNCTFFGNNANENGGAIFGGGEVINCIFYKNIASEQDNDINVDIKFKIDYSLFNNLTGVADIGPNNIMGDPKFIDSDNGDFSLVSDSPCINKGAVLVSNKNAGKRKTSIVKKSINMGANLDFKMIKDLLTPKSEQEVDSLN